MAEGGAHLAEVKPTRLFRTFKFRLLPRKAQHLALREALEHTRDLYNSGLEERIAAYRKTGMSRSWQDQCRGLTELRSGGEFSRFPITLQRWPLKKLDLAFQAFFRRLKASGGKAGFPRFKGANQFNSFGFSQSQGWKVDGRRLYMKGIGRVAMHMHRPLPSRPLSCTIKRECKGWSVLLVCEVPLEPLASTGRQVGIDLGITSFVAASTGEMISGLRISRRASAETRRRARALSRCKRSSKRRRKAAARLAKHHKRIANARRTFHHQVAAYLVRENDLIAIEGLNVKGLARSILARDVHDAGWGSFIELLAEKAEKAGRALVRVDPRFTSQECSSCGLIAPKTLSQRTHKCGCGCVLDRDHNAAINILKRAVVRPLQPNVGGCVGRAARNLRATEPLPRRYDPNGETSPCCRILITLLIVLCVIALIYWAVNALPLPQPVRVIAVVIIAIVGAIYLLSMLPGVHVGL